MSNFWEKFSKPLISQNWGKKKKKTPMETKMKEDNPN
jgi:hypothetical protein